MNALGIISCLSLVLVLMVCGLWARRQTARRSGWKRLRERYPATLRSPAPCFARASVRVNQHWFRELLTVRIDGGGIGIAARRPFRAFHGPIFLPWDDLTPVESQNEGEVQLQVGDDAAITLTGRAAVAANRLMERRHLLVGRD